MAEHTATVRLAWPADAAAVRAVYAPLVRDTAISFELTPPTTAEMRERITATTRTHPWLVAVDEAEENLCGFAYASPHRDHPAYRWSTEVSVYVRSGAQGAGIGRALYSTLFDVLERQGFVSALAGIALPNPASVGLHRSAGFRPVGVYRNVGFKLGEWHDVAWWQRPLRPRTHLPAEPRDLPELLEAGELDDVLGADDERRGRSDRAAWGSMRS